MTKEQRCLIEYGFYEDGMPDKLLTCQRTLGHDGPCAPAVETTVVAAMEACPCNHADCLLEAGRPIPKGWYCHKARVALPAAETPAPHRHEGSLTVDRGETCLKCGKDYSDPVHAVETPALPVNLMYECRDALALHDRHNQLYLRVWEWCQEAQQKGSPAETAVETATDRDYEVARDAYDQAVLELERYQKALQTANGFLIMHNLEPVKLKYSSEGTPHLLASWRLTDEHINSVQVESVDRLIKRAQAAHFVNVRMRINGGWEEHEADWIKHVKREPTLHRLLADEVEARKVHGPPLTEQPSAAETPCDGDTPVRASTAEVVLPKTAESTAIPVHPSLTLVMSCLELKSGESFRVQVIDGLSDAFWYGLSALFAGKAAEGTPVSEPYCTCPDSYPTYAGHLPECPSQRDEVKTSAATQCGNPTMVNTEWYGPCTLLADHDGDCRREVKASGWCPAKCDDGQCQLPAGHSGLHQHSTSGHSTSW